MTNRDAVSICAELVPKWEQLVELDPLIASCCIVIATAPHASNAAVAERVSRTYPQVTETSVRYARWRMKPRPRSTFTVEVC